MTGFQSPNYTQVPNDYFDLVMEMTEAENHLLAALLRTTFGYHRDEIQLSIRDLAEICKMDPQSIQNAAKKLEERGLIERTVRKSRTVTEWTVRIEDTKLYEKIVKTVRNGTGELGVKERNKQINKEKEDDDDLIKRQIILEGLYQESLGAMTPLVKNLLRNVALTYQDPSWYETAFEAAAKNNGRSLSYIEKILENWKRDGRPKNGKKPILSTEEKIRKFVEA